MENNKNLMNPEISTAEELDLPTNKNTTSRGPQTIEATEEQLRQIHHMLASHPGHLNELNFIIETRATAEQVVSDMEAFLYPDGEGKLNASNLLDAKILKFIDMGEIMRGIRNRIGKRAS